MQQDLIEIALRVIVSLLQNDEKTHQELTNWQVLSLYNQQFFLLNIL